MPAPSTLSIAPRALTRSLLVALVASSLARLPAQVVYTGPGGTATTPTTGAWNNSSNWAGGVMPSSDAATHLSFGGSGTTSYIATNDLGTFTLNTLTLASTSTGTVTLAGSPLHFDGATPTVTQTGSGAVTIAADLNFAFDTTFNVAASAGALTLSGVLSGIANNEFDESTTLTKTGAGTLIIGGSSANTLATISVEAGQLKLAKTSGVALTGALDVSASATVTLQSGGQLSTDAWVYLDGTLDLNNHDTTITVLFDKGDAPTGGEVRLGTAQLTLDAGTSIFTGQITGAGSLRLTGGSFAALAGANTYTGGTTIDDGELAAVNLTGSATGTGPVTVGINGMLSGDGFIVPSSGNQVTINGTLYPGFQGDVLTFGSATTSTTVTLGPTSFLLIDICGCNEATSVYIYGQLQILTGATLDIHTGSESPLSGTYTLATFTEGRTGSLFSSVVFNNDNIPDPAAAGAFGGTHHLVYGPTSLTLQPSAIPEPATYATLAGLFALGLAAQRRRPRSAASPTRSA